MALDTDDFTALATQFARVDLFGFGPPAPPWGRQQTGQKVAAAISSGRNRLPLVYQNAYVAQLEDNLQSLLGGSMEPWAAPVYEHAAGSSVSPQLDRFLAVVSNLYRSFLDKAKRNRLALPAPRMNPPLAFFQNRGNQGPYTITSEQVERFVGSSVGIVSLPSTYRDSPILWSALAHETGGHDVIHADAGLLDELGTIVRALFDPTPVTFGEPVGRDQVLGLLWSYWIDEAASDIYGILNIGPSFAANLAALFAAFGANNPSPFPSLPVESGPNRERNDQIDEHPTGILRLHLAIGAIQNLTSLSRSSIDAYVGDISAIAELCAQGAQTVNLTGFLPVDNDQTIPLNKLEIPLTEMQEAARKVGAAIVSAKLRALQGHGIQEIETWDDGDEAIAQQISGRYKNGESVAGRGDDAQLLAGATLAVLSQPSLYDQVTTMLNDGLDDSFSKDPIWGRLRTDTAFMPGVFSPKKAEAVKSKTVKRRARRG
jgi:hypothetical protein